jgi:hypothetical protein
VKTFRPAISALFAVVLFAADDIPQWVRDAAAQTSPTYPAKVSSVVLLQEEHLTVDPDGRRVMRERGVIRILQRSRESISAYRTYNTKSGRIRDFQGWLLPASGKSVNFGKPQVLDVALSRDYTYDEGRAKVLDPGADLQPGSVFAYEVVEEEKSIFTQYQYRFQESLPVLLSRFTLTLPGAWEVKGTIYNHEAVQPAVVGGVYTWELRNLRWIEDEDYRPDIHALAPRLAVSYFPSGDNRAGLAPLKDWQAVSGWLTDFVDPQAELTAALKEKALELTKDAKTELQKIQAIAAFAQQTNYVAVQMNITRGGGYTPHRAGEVLARNYGDCKDKATLMRALLKPLGIDSYMTAIYSGDRQHVRPEWPSPQVFNHAIIAVKVSDATKLETVLHHPRLGSLLIFDPTNPDTPVGDLPEDEQGSNALIIAGASGELAVMPLLPAAASRVESKVEAQLNGDGHLSAHVFRNYFGQDAAQMRGFTRRRSPEELKKSFERGLSRRLGGITLKSIVPVDDIQEGRLSLEMEYDVARFGQLMQQRLFVIEPGSLLSGNDYGFAAKERKSPVRLTANVRKDSVIIQIPAGFKIDEMPDPVALDTPYGIYNATWSSRAGQIVFEQSLEVKDNLVPASSYAAVRDFFEKLSSGQHSAVVLLKQ